MVLDFSTPDGLAQLDCAFADPPPAILCYPNVASQVKVQGMLMAVSQGALQPDAFDRFDRHISKLIRAVTAA